MSRLPSEDTLHSERVRTVRHESARGWWTMSLADPHPALAGLVRSYCGWEEHTVAPLWRIEPPGPDLPLIILFGAPVLARATERDQAVREVGSFVAGLYDRHTLVGSAGRMAGIQANFTPLGARLLLGQPLESFANRMIEIADVWGREADRITTEFATLPTWAARFDCLDRFVLGKIAAASRPHAALVWSVEALLATGGQVRVEALARRAGWSRRHFGQTMRHEFGLGPKTLARVLRLGRAVEALKAHGESGLAEIAAACGYYDQAHFTRDFREFTGTTPAAFAGRLLPDAGGVSA
jgi:AraC-like DNA-binding protein